MDYLQEKQVLFLRNDLKKLRSNENKYYKIIQFYQAKLVALGAMKNVKNHCISNRNYKRQLTNSKRQSLKELVKFA